MICQNSVSLTQFDNRLSPAITEMVFIHKPLKPLSIIRSSAVVSDAARSWGGSAAKGGSHGAYKVRTQVPHTAPPHEQLPWFPPLALCIKKCQT
ncbi:MAG: hypothetical protein F6K55_11680 [Moorea sp. SIO4A3]|nr:hypothetical protein [Moorena sp. SIO4A3]